MYKYKYEVCTYTSRKRKALENSILTLIYMFSWVNRVNFYISYILSYLILFVELLVIIS